MRKKAPASPPPLLLFFLLFLLVEETSWSDSLELEEEEPLLPLSLPEELEELVGVNRRGGMWWALIGIVN